MKTKIILFSIALVSILGLTTCRKELSYPTTDLCFETKIKPIFISNCTTSGCHNSSDHRNGLDYTTYEGIMKSITKKHPKWSEAYNVLNQTGDGLMPPKGKLNSSDILLIKQWIEIGAPGGCNSTPNACDTTDFKYSTRVSSIMTSNCVGCHDASNPGGGYDLSSYSAVVVTIQSGKFLDCMKQINGTSPMPKNTNKLSDCEINAIEKWVNAGYPNN